LKRVKTRRPFACGYRAPIAPVHGQGGKLSSLRTYRTIRLLPFARRAMDAGNDDKPISTPAPPRRLRKWLGRLTATMLGIVVVACVAYAMALPLVVRSVVGGILVKAGLPDAHFTVTRATFWRTTLSDLTALEGNVRIGSFDVTYRPLAILGGVVERITISGTKLHATIRNGKLVAPKLPGAGTTRPTTSPTSPAASPLPFRKAELTGATAEVDWEGQPILIPLSGVIDVNDAGTASGRLTAGLQVPAGSLDLSAANGKLRGRSGVLSLDVTLDGEVAVGGDGYHWKATVHAGNTDDVIFDSAGVDAELGRIALAADASGVTNAATGTTQGGRVTFDAQWSALPDAVLTANGSLQHDKSGFSGRVVANLPSKQYDDAQILARHVPLLREWEVTGTLGARAEVTIERNRPHGQVTVTVDKADFASKDAGVEVHGLGGSVSVNVAAGGVSTSAPQRLAAGRAAFGSVDMADVVLAVRLDGSGAVLVDELSAHWLGGRVSTANVRINPADPKFETTLVADRIQLRELLALAAEGRARGEGLISGNVVLRVNGSQVSFGKGQLRSDSPTGEIQVADTEWLGAALDASDPRFAAAGELNLVKERILNALKDFTYDRLTFTFAEEPASRGLLQVNTHGKGRTGPRPQELDMTLNFRGINDAVDLGNWFKGLWDKLTHPTAKARAPLTATTRPVKR
jgi:hypothetical protein